MIMGRMKPGTAVELVQASLDPVFQQSALEGWNSASPDLRNAGLDRDQPRSPARLIVSSAATGVDNMSDDLRAVTMLSIVTGLILMTVCANIANLLLAKSSSRQKEIAVRLSMGASRRRLLRQLLTERLLGSVLGGLLAIIFAVWLKEGLIAVSRWGGRWMGTVLQPRLDCRVLGFTLAL